MMKYALLLTYLFQPRNGVGIQKMTNISITEKMNNILNFAPKDILEGGQYHPLGSLAMSPTSLDTVVYFSTCRSNESCILKQSEKWQ